ncbi:GTPase domain-containing protein [candidate division KSB1 bacterium]|nr:GTPase domain-containing protein [candidate division KSB1 bacterium]
MSRNLNQTLSLLQSELNPIRFLPGTDYFAAQTNLLNDVRFILGYKLLPEVSNELSFPLLISFAGGTNVGKSTLFNLISGGNFSPADPVGGNTRTPVFVFPSNHQPFKAFLNTLETQTAAFSNEELHVHHLKTFDSICFIDSPDIDSTNLQNHALAEKLLLLADVVIFVTTKEKYADQKPMHSLSRAFAIDKEIILIFNKTSNNEFSRLYSDFAAKSQMHPVHKLWFPYISEPGFEVEHKRRAKPYPELIVLSEFLTQLNQRHTEIKQRSVKQHLKFIIASWQSLRNALAVEQNKIAEISKNLTVLKKQSLREYEAFIKGIKFIEFESAVEQAVKDLKIPVIDAIYDKMNDALAKLLKAGKTILNLEEWQTHDYRQASPGDREIAILKRKEKDRQFITTLIKKHSQSFLSQLGNQKNDPVSKAIYESIDIAAFFAHVQESIPRLHAEIDTELAQQFRDLIRSIENWFSERRTTRYSLIAIKLLLMAGIGVLSALLTGGIGLEDLVISSISPLIVKQVLEFLNPHLSFIKNERQRFEKIHLNTFERIFNRVITDYFECSVFRASHRLDLKTTDNLISRLRSEL